MAGGELTPEQFRVWVEARNIRTSMPGVRGIGFIKRVERHDLEAFIRAERAKGATDFSVRTTGDAADLYIISRIEPLSNNRKAWGYDVGSESVRRAAAEAAVSTGQPTLTGRVTLLQDGTKRPGFLYFYPVFRQGTNPVTAAERKAALVGLVYAPIVAQELLGDIVSSYAGQLHYGLFDGSGLDAAELLVGDPHQNGARFERQQVLTIGSRALTLDMGS
ncbi:MAG: CHASE domain-containing protein, partial [Pseudomonadota bacterium]